MRVLVLAYFYPPYVAAGAPRAGQLVRGWRRSGAEVAVVAARPKDLPRFGELDEPGVVWTQLFDVNALARTVLRRDVTRGGYDSGVSGPVRALGDAYRQLVHFPDSQIGWLPALVSAASKAGREFRPDVIITSSPPATTHIAGAILRGRLGIPWVAELRDPWTENPYFRRWPGLRQLEQRLERATLRRADLLVGVTPTLTRQLERFGPPVAHVPNGFSPEDYPRAVEVDPQLLLHVGTVYPSYDLATLLEALRTASNPPSTRFLGRSLGPLHAALSSAGNVNVEIVPPVSRLEALRLMSAAWANLAFIYRSRDGRVRQEYAQQKFYEYLGAGRPIIVVGPRQGDGAELLQRSGLARFAGDAAELRALFDDRSWSTLARPDPEFVSGYSYEGIAARYLELLEEVRSRSARAR